MEQFLLLSTPRIRPKGRNCQLLQHLTLQLTKMSMRRTWSKVWRRSLRMIPLISTWSTRRLSRSPTWLWLTSRVRQLRESFQLKRASQKCVRRHVQPIWLPRWRARGPTWTSLKRNPHRTILLTFNIRKRLFLPLPMPGIHQWAALEISRTAWWWIQLMCRSTRQIWERQRRKCPHPRDSGILSRRYSSLHISWSRQLAHSLQSQVSAVGVSIWLRLRETMWVWWLGPPLKESKTSSWIRQTY